MADHHMSAREALDVVTSAVNLGGFVSEAHKARYARACGIVAALEKERAKYAGVHGNNGAGNFEVGAVHGLTKAIDIVKELSK